MPKRTQEEVQQEFQDVVTAAARILADDTIGIIAESVRGRENNVVSDGDLIATVANQTGVQLVQLAAKYADSPGAKRQFEIMSEHLKAVVKAAHKQYEKEKVVDLGGI